MSYRNSVEALTNAKQQTFRSTSDILDTVRLHKIGDQIQSDE